MLILRSATKPCTPLTSLSLQLYRQCQPKCLFSSLSHLPCPSQTAVSVNRVLCYRQTLSTLMRPGSVALQWTSEPRTSPSRAFSAQKSGEEGGMGGEKLSLQLAGRHVQIPLVWLRDHCQCSTCFNGDNLQKNVHTYSLHNLAVMESRIDGDVLQIKWQDGHISQFSLEWLNNNFHCPGSQVERFLWNGKRMNNQQLPVTPFNLHMNSEDGLKNTLSNIIKYGFCIVDGAPATEEGTSEVSSCISFMQETVFGRLTTMVSGELDHNDSAYSNVPLGAHNDNTYYSIPAGLQVFHCLHHDGEGGRTLLVDGFNAAEELRRSNPSLFDTLVKTVIPHQYIDKSGYHLYSLATVLSTDLMTGALTHIRFNPYDRAPLRTVPPEDIVQFYQSYEALTQIIRSQDSELWIKLLPGMVLVVDNWRVMHGRSGFTGRRVLCGCYLPRDDWTSRARVLGLL